MEDEAMLVELDATEIETVSGGLVGPIVPPIYPPILWVLQKIAG